MINTSHTLRKGRTSSGSDGASTTTKMKKFFKERNVGQAVLKKAGGAIGPELAKKLTALVAMEKNILRNADNVAKARPENAHQLSVWGEEQTEDVSDVSDKVAVLLNEVGTIESRYVDRGDQYRQALKDIREIEKATQGTRDKKQKVTEQIEKTQQKDREKEKDLSTDIKQLEQELTRVNAESLVAEAQLVNVTREQFKTGLEYQFEAMREYGEKLAIIAGYGKHLLELIGPPNASPGDAPQEYHSHEASAAIITECDQRLRSWGKAEGEISTDLPEHLQSKLHVSETGKEHDELAEKPHLERRWSSDSDPDASEAAKLAEPRE